MIAVHGACVAWRFGAFSALLLCLLLLILLFIEIHTKGKPKT